MRVKLTNKYIQSLDQTTCDLKHHDTEIKNFYLRVNKTTMVFCYRVLLDGKENTYKLGRYPDITVTQARELAKQAAGKVASGIDIQQAKKAARIRANNEKKTTLRGYIDNVYADYLIIEKRTGSKILQNIETHFSQWENKKLTDINPFLVGSWRKAQLRKGLTNGAVNRPIGYLRALLNHAYRHAKVIDHHPLDTFKKLPEDKNKITRYLSVTEEDRLRQAMMKRDTAARLKRETANNWRKQREYKQLPEMQLNDYSDYLTPMVLLALNTGMRRGELFNLKWSDVDFISKTLAVLGAGAKSGHTRIIPLNSEALGALIKWRNQTTSKSHVFTTQHGKLTDIKTAFNNLLKAAYIKGFRFHDLRHQFASKLAMAGVDLNTIRELLGHSTLELTLRYAHLAPNIKAKAVELL